MNFRAARAEIRHQEWIKEQEAKRAGEPPARTHDPFKAIEACITGIDSFLGSIEKELAKLRGRGPQGGAA